MVHTVIRNSDTLDASLLTQVIEYRIRFQSLLLPTHRIMQQYQIKIIQFRFLERILDCREGGGGAVLVRHDLRSDEDGGTIYSR